MRLAPERYRPVSDAGLASTSDDHRVAEVAQAPERREEPVVVALVQPDARLVEDVEHADEPGADLRRQPDALRLAPGERLGRAVHGQVVEPDVHEEAEPLAHLLEDRGGDLGVEARAPVAADRDGLGEGERVGDGLLGERADVEAVDRDRERLGLQPPAAARLAGRGDHVLVEIEAHRVALGLLVAPLDVAEDPLPRRGLALLRRQAVQQRLLHLGRQLPPPDVELELERLGEPGEDHAPQVAVRLAPGQDDALEDRDRRIAEDELRAHLLPHPEAAARRARAEGRIEREVPRLELGHRGAAGGAAEALGEQPAFGGRAVVPHDLDDAVGQLERGLERVGEASAVLAPDGEPVHHDRHVVILAAVERGGRGDLDERAVHVGAHVALLAHLLEEVAELPLPAPDHRGEHLEARPRRPREHDVGDLPRAHPLDRPPAGGAVRGAGAGVEQAQVVVDLGDGADGRARVVAGALLLDRDGRREPLDGVHVGLLHEPEELPRVGRQRLDVPPLPLGVDRVEGERRLAAPRQPGDDGQAVARDRHVDVPQVVLAGAADDQSPVGGVVGHSPVSSPAS